MNVPNCRRAALLVVSALVLPSFVFGQVPHSRAAKEDVIWSGGAGSFRWKWTAWDLTASSAETGRIAFSATAFERRASPVLKALLSDKAIQETLKRNNTHGTPRNTAQFVQLLKGKSFGGDDNSQFAFEEDFLTRFAFHHVYGDQVGVRLNVGWNYEIYRFSTTQIGILLPVPARLRGALNAAATRKQGFLMADAKKIAADRTTILFTLGKEPR